MQRSTACFIASICLLGFFSTSAAARDTQADVSNAACTSLAIAPNASTWCTTWGSEEDAKSILTLQALWIGKNCTHPPDLSFIATDFRGMRINGTHYGREIATMSNGGDDPTRKDRECRMSDVDVRFFSDSTAVLFGGGGLIRMRDGQERKICEAWTVTWVKREGKWYLVAVQDNAEPCEQWWPNLRDLRTILPNYEEIYKKN